MTRKRGATNHNLYSAGTDIAVPDADLLNKLVV
jgi:hypothetical protein